MELACQIDVVDKVELGKEKWLESNLVVNCCQEERAVCIRYCLLF